MAFSWNLLYMPTFMLSSQAAWMTRSSACGSLSLFSINGFSLSERVVKFFAFHSFLGSMCSVMSEFLKNSSNIASQMMTTVSPS